MTYTISEMARLLGVAPSTLRYYDKEGLLPPIERSAGGIRVFRDKEYEWLRIIECLKQTGMQLRDIRAYLRLTLQGDKTISERKQLFERRREEVKKQMETLRHTLDTLDFKCWYYEKAEELGSTLPVESMPPEEIPESYRDAYIQLHRLPQESQVETLQEDFAHEDHRNR